MRGTLLILKADGTESERRLEAPPPLEELQTAVGGYIEMVPMRLFNRWKGERAVMFCDEDGKRKQYPVNLRATALAPGLARLNDVLVGDVVIIAGDPELMAEL